ncbi:MAG: DUF4349 domain-containing protein [Alicyclobacillus macrosporangiidus]|uniref:DUF4349 domain-containing protein n=1 Tax=Alicyclobacillus macrosporangiidus TaxID=392015 RepID=UPI0026EECB23|nr:DUF4349 domain-containing protein [Alicyclobacillus macrosporangiidus]MCL6599268.1 DUF4349 domain-containing protein [Alicyclobacillus macrosporangiidus]
MLKEKNRWVQSIWQRAGAFASRSWVIVAAIAVLAAISAVVFNTNAFQVGSRGSASSAAVSTASGSAQSAMPSSGQAAHGSADVAQDVAQQAAAGAIAASKTAVATTTQRMVIEQATVNISTSDVRQAAAKVSRMVEGYGGFVESSRESTDNGQLTVWMTVRVPETDFTPFLNGVKGLGTVTNFSQTGQDVTQQYNGLQQQLEELKSEADAYTRLFNKAQTMKDMIDIQQALVQVNSQIAQLNQQLHDLNRSVQLATVNLTLTPPSFAGAASGDTPVIEALLQSFHVLQKSAYALVTMIAWLLPWGVLAALALLGRRWWMRRRRHP